MVMMLSQRCQVTPCIRRGIVRGRSASVSIGRWLSGTVGITDLKVVTQTISLETFRDKFWQPQCPVILRGAAGLNAVSPMCWAWTAPELLLRLADHQHRRLVSSKKKRRTRRRTDGDIFMTDALVPEPGANFVSQWRSKKVHLGVDEALRKFVNSENSIPSLQCRLDPALFWHEHEELPLFMRDDRFHAIFNNSFVWVTSSGLRTSLHSDEDHGLLAHLSGRKRAMLISPALSDQCKKTLSELMSFRWKSGSLLELYDRKHQSSELVRSMRPMFANLEPGDLLYIPKRWLHDIESLDTTVSITIRFDIARK